MKNKIIALLIIFLSLSTCSIIYAETKIATSEISSLNVNDKQISIASYKIDDQSYFMLRDLAYMLNFTNKKIDINWDKDKKALKIIPNTTYNPTGIEMLNPKTKNPVKANPSKLNIYYGENKIDITSYEINGHNYLRLEDLALLLDTLLVYENNKVVGMDTNMPYNKEKHIFSPSDNVTVLLYHHFVNEVPSKDHYYTTVSKDKFENDMKKLLKKGYQPLSLENYYLNKYNKNKKYFVLTFDDGYLSNYEIAFDIIKKYNVYVDIFINTDSIDKDNRFKLNQAKEMEDSGLIKIYSHYPLHIDVTNIEAAEYTNMLKKSIETLETVLDKKDFYFFAYPYGFYNKEKYDLTKEAGYKLQAIQTVTYNGNDLIIRHNVTQITNVLDLISSISR